MACACCCYCGTGRIFEPDTPPGKLLIDLGNDGWTIELQEVTIGSESYDLIVYRCPMHPTDEHPKPTTEIRHAIAGKASPLPVCDDCANGRHRLCTGDPYCACFDGLDMRP